MFEALVKSTYFSTGYTEACFLSLPFLSKRRTPSTKAFFFDALLVRKEFYVGKENKMFADRAKIYVRSGKGGRTTRLLSPDISVITCPLCASLITVPAGTLIMMSSPSLPRQFFLPPSSPSPAFVGKENKMFADRAKIYVRSGKGGDGHVSFRREKYFSFPT